MFVFQLCPNGLHGRATNDGFSFFPISPEKGGAGHFTEIADLKKGVTTVTEEVTAVKGNLEEFGKRVDGLEDETAVRKSGDLGGVVQGTQIKKGSMWGGRFLNSADLYH